MLIIHYYRVGGPPKIYAYVVPNTQGFLVMVVHFNFLNSYPVLSFSGLRYHAGVVQGPLPSTGRKRRFPSSAGKPSL